MVRSKKVRHAGQAQRSETDKASLWETTRIHASGLSLPRAGDTAAAIQAASRTTTGTRGARAHINS